MSESETVTMYQIYDPRNRMYLGFANTPDYSNWLWCRNKKEAYNFDTLRDVYEQLLQLPYHGVDAEDDPVNYCKIVKVQVSDPMRSLELAKNDLKAVSAIKTEPLNLKQEISTASAMDKTTADLITMYSGAFTNTVASLKDKRDYLADLLRENVPDISEDEVIHYVHKHLPERYA